MRRCAVLFTLAMLMGLLGSPVSAQSPPCAATPPISPSAEPPNYCHFAIPVAPFQDSATFRYFPETGHALGNGFKAFWETHGGLAIFGHPISEEFGERQGRGPGFDAVLDVQYFERARFEYHPEFRGTPYEVELSRLGSEQVVTGNALASSGGTSGSPFAPVSEPANCLPPFMDNIPPCLFFPQTGHTIWGFYPFWQQHGGVAVFGYPISEDYLAPDGADVQYFERARFESRYVGKGIPRPFTLGLIGVESARAHGYIR